MVVAVKDIDLRSWIVKQSPDSTNREIEILKVLCFSLFSIIGRKGSRQFRKRRLNKRFKLILFANLRTKLTVRFYLSTSLNYLSNAV